MLLITKKIFDPCSFLLQNGIFLLESSAGTGKTEILSMLYLRCLIGNCDFYNVNKKAMKVEDILVVTFTDLATQKLRSCIKDKIRSFYVDCTRGYSDNVYLSQLLLQISDIDVVMCQLLEAEANMDNASICTIHSFCWNILRMYPIECNFSLGQKMLTDEYALYEQAVVNFWRSYFYSLDCKLIRVIQKYWKEPYDLLMDLSPYLFGNITDFYCSCNFHESFESRYKLIIFFIEKFKNRWCKTVFDVCNILKYYDCEKKIITKRMLLLWLKKIYVWVNTKTVDYWVPKELKYFECLQIKSSVLKNISNVCDVPYYILFRGIKRLYHKIFSFRELILHVSLREVRNEVMQKKIKTRVLGYEDMLLYLENALSSRYGFYLSNMIRSLYPVVLIDEFQDIDFRQYNIFYKIYFNNCIINFILFFVGDPKQLIYSFRGSDVFLYMRIKRIISFRYTLDINYRSSESLVNAINCLFLSLPSSFVFRDISFFSSFSLSDRVLKFVVNDEVQPAMQFVLQSCVVVKRNEYKKFMAYQFSLKIYNLLFYILAKKAWLQDASGSRLLKLSDIVVLVRNRDEAKIMYDALANFSIPAVFLSYYNCSVFKTLEARDLLWVLYAILSPEDDVILFRALSTDIFGFDITYMHFVRFYKKKKREELVAKFILYRLIWEKYGILAMLRVIFIQDRMVKNLLSFFDGKRRFLNIMHIGELLQCVSKKFDNQRSLLYWFMFNIRYTNSRSKDHMVKMDSDNHAVRIMTIHAAKGLEFPIVFLPFITDFFSNKYCVFHDRETYKVVLDFCGTSDINRFLSEEERLSEDLRLLYVAVTRAVYHCSIGIAAVFCSGSRRIMSDVHRSAIGYLVQKGCYGDYSFLRDCLQLLQICSKNDISFYDAEIVTKNHVLNLKEVFLFFKKKSFCQSLLSKCFQYVWCVTSYSGLSGHGYFLKNNSVKSLSCIFNDISGENCVDVLETSLNSYNFPKGKFSGVFLHYILESMDFTKKLDEVWLYDQLRRYGIDVIWLPVLIKWLENIIYYSLNGSSLSLSSITLDMRKSEFSFCLSVNKIVKAEDLENICKNYDALSRRAMNFNFSYIYGTIKGSIDLVFFWNGRYYLLDYKSTWLGNDYTCYSCINIENVMIDFRYDLQYQIYTLALHRFLKNRLMHYDYQCDFGGVYYLFLRGMDLSHPGCGVYYCLPSVHLINKLDVLFC
ncbi:MAG: exodeoxyribonuclease V subunit RecB [Candidatus Westeberhardia cardiocondylae]|nr:exodeoxyribonuclease V subunit RecB [Candidatus Westeberhardia cardiocondylae]